MKKNGQDMRMVWSSPGPLQPCRFSLEVKDGISPSRSQSVIKVLTQDGRWDVVYAESLTQLSSMCASSITCVGIREQQR